MTRCFLRLAPGLLLLFVSQSYGQSYLFAGPNVDWVRASSLRGTVEPRLGYRLGGEITLHRVRANSLDFPLRLSINRIGYRQSLADSTYQVNMAYFIASPGVRYRPGRFLAANFALDLMVLLSARFREVDAAPSAGVISTYQNFGLALRGELVLWNHRLVSPYLSFSHALLPALRYPRIDAVGNFRGTIRDIWHRTLGLGLRVRL